MKYLFFLFFALRSFTASPISSLDFIIYSLRSRRIMIDFIYKASAILSLYKHPWLWGIVMIKARFSFCLYFSSHFKSEICNAPNSILKLIYPIITSYDVSYNHSLSPECWYNARIAISLLQFSSAVTNKATGCWQAIIMTTCSGNSFSPEFATSFHLV